MANPQAFTMAERNKLLAPLDMEDARQAYRESGRQRFDARAALEVAIDHAADAEREYRKGLAQAFVRAEGDTAAMREADARSRAADLSYARDKARDMVKAAQERLNEIDANRQSLNRLVEWSQRIDPMAMEDRTPRQAA